MVVLIYRRNDEEAYADACRIEAQAKYPDAKIREKNGKYFRENAMDKADVVYVHAGLTTIRNAYVHAGATVITSAPDEPAEVFTDKYEAEILRLLSLSVKNLAKALKTVRNPELVTLALEREKATRNRKSAIEVYETVLAG